MYEGGGGADGADGGADGAKGGVAQCAAAFCRLDCWLPVIFGRLNWMYFDNISASPGYEGGVLARWYI